MAANSFLGCSPVSPDTMSKMVDTATVQNLVLPDPVTSARRIVAIFEAAPPFGGPWPPFREP
jgi:hypothetical protein